MSRPCACLTPHLCLLCTAVRCALLAPPSDLGLVLPSFPVGTYDGLEFCGLVLTKLAQENLTHEELDAFKTKLTNISAHQMDFKSHMREILSVDSLTPTLPLHFEYNDLICP